MVMFVIQDFVKRSGAAVLEEGPPSSKRGRRPRRGADFLEEGPTSFFGRPAVPRPLQQPRS